MVLVTTSVYRKFFALVAKNLTLTIIQLFSQVNENIHHIYIIYVDMHKQKRLVVSLRWLLVLEIIVGQKIVQFSQDWTVGKECAKSTKTIE